MKNELVLYIYILNREIDEKKNKIKFKYILL